MKGNLRQHRPGQVVTVDGAAYRLLDRALPSGWWGSPTAGGPIVRLVSSRRYGDVQARFRVAEAVR